MRTSLAQMIVSQARLARATVIALLLGALGWALPVTPAAAADPPAIRAFDHLTTGFELIGQHRDLPCESCHVNAVYKGTLKDCSGCHGVGTAVRATAKPATHILSSDRCEACHTPIAFKPAVSFDHAEVRGSCSTCHNGVQAQGKGPTHIQTDLECDACHSTIGWAGAVFSHAGVTSGCASCHNGVSATGMPASHIPTGGAPCESCHSTTNFTTWAGTPMNHTAVASLRCDACHEAGMSFFGVTIVTRPPPPHPAVGSGDCSACHLDTISFKSGNLQPANHIPTTQACALCHANPADYSIYKMDHTGISGNCAQCHASGLSFANMAPPTLKEPPTNHIPFGSASCESCHSATNFTTFTVANASPPMNHAAVSGLACATCHGAGQSWAGTPATVVEPANHVPIGTTACTNCHSATNFTTFVIPNAVPPMNHTGFASNCAGCHGSGQNWIGTPAVKSLPGNHIPTAGAPCESCHSSSSFSSFSFTNASGAAPPSMVHTAVTSIACSACHEMGLTWAGTPATVVRPALKANGQPHQPAGECSTCHFNTTSFKGATDFPSNHIPVPGSGSSTCTSCHTNAANYAVYSMDHSVVTSEACAQCHGAGLSFANMVPPTLKEPPSNHIPFGTAACESCHSSTTFTSFAITNKSPPMNHAAVSSLACTSCHSAGQTWAGTPATVVEPGNHIPIGTSACTNCHSSTNFTTFVIPNAVPPMNHTGFASNCASCHGPGQNWIGTPAVKTLPGNHIPTGTTACEGCHSSSNFSSFAFSNASGTAPPSMVHSLVTSSACSTCHEKGLTWAGAPPTIVRPMLKADGTAHVPAGECSTCHFNTTSFKGASDLPANHIPLPAADNNNCALCHTTAGNYSLATMNHVNIAANCSQCHGAGLSFANMAPPALKEPPTNHIPFGTAACESCHAATTFTNFVVTNKSPPMNHAAVSSLACTSCHGAGQTWAGTPATVVFPAANHIPTGNTACTNCHSPTNFTTFAIANAVPPMNHTGFATNCISCHGVGQSWLGTPAVKTLPSNHVPTGTIACEGCHSSSVFSTFAFPNASGTAPASMVHSLVTATVCSTCHEKGLAWAGTPATVVRPALKANGTTHVAAGECSTCHFNTTSFKGATDLPANHIPLPAADNNNCALCHTTSDYSVYTMNHVNITANCAQCHGAGLSFANMAPPTLKEPPTTPRAHIPFGTVTCESCHTPTVFTTFSGTVMKHAAVRAMTCTSCHELGMNWLTNTGVRLWVRPSANHHAGQDCGGSGCHSTRDKRGLRPQLAAAVRPGAAGVTNALAAVVPPGASTAALGRPGGFDHRRVAGQTCVTCHDATSGMGKPLSHLITSNDCASCHTTISWLPVAQVDHSQVRGSCVSCHNGRLAPGKSSTHLASSDSCESCHTTNAWTPARFDHAGVAAGSCVSCHNGLRAAGLPVNHIPTSQQCDACHGTLAWTPVKLDHRPLTSNCVSCHNGRTATGLPQGHMSTQRDCALCHSYPDWTLIGFRHASVAYPGDHHVTLGCVSCHTSNADTVPYPSMVDAGTCGGCHAKDYKASVHLKTVGGVTYTASELRNCSGACHVYSDSTFSSVAKSVPGPYHRVTDAAFKH